MKYIIKGTSNTLVFKLNDTLVNKFSGEYNFSFKNVQTNNIISLILTDVSATPNIFQKFIISTGDSLNFLVGQYELRIYDVTASTTQILFENVSVFDNQKNNQIYFMPNSNSSSIFESSSTSIPEKPINFSAFLMPSGSDIQLRWELGSTNTDSFELWRKTSGGTYIAAGLD